MGELIVTNNERVRDAYAARCPIEFVAGGLSDVLVRVRDLVHRGCLLLTHPLSGSVKPNENPFKSVLLRRGSETPDEDSLRIIENSIVTARKFAVKYKEIPQEILQDFQTIDYSLFLSAFS